MKKKVIFVIFAMLAYIGFIFFVGLKDIAAIQEASKSSEAIEEENLRKFLASVGDSPDNPLVLEPESTFEDNPNSDGVTYTPVSDGMIRFLGAHRGTPYGDRIAEKPLYVMTSGKLYVYASEMPGLAGETIDSDWGWADGGIVLETCFTEEEGYSEDNQMVHTFHYRPYTN